MRRLHALEPGVMAVPIKDDPASCEKPCRHDSHTHPNSETGPCPVSWPGGTRECSWPHGDIKF